MALGDHLEQGGDGFVGDVEVAEFIDHQQPWAGEEAHAGVPAPFQGGAVTAGGEVGGGGEVDPVPGIDRCAGEADRQHCLPDSGWADEQDVGGVVEEPQGGQVTDQGLVDTGLGGEVELVQRPRLGQAGEPQPAALAAGLDRGDLDGHQLLQRCGQPQALVAGGVEDPRQGLGCVGA
jgi:hypothetical protein